jgi:2-dehydro-3-deoxyphosphogluconate aldolase/(4S)-4-hydroxy-2-oxoglutarate aldolase
MESIQEGRSIMLNELFKHKIVTVVRGSGAEDAKGIVNALYDGGIRFIEFTFDQTEKGYKSTLGAIEYAAKDGRVHVGAGTVLTKEQVDLAKAAGAKYIISPSVDVDVIKYTKAQGLISIPGALTPTEVVTAYNAGADVVKLFPISDLGVAYLKAVRAPLKHIPLMAVGGVDETNIVSFIKAGAVGVGLGGNIVDMKLVKAGDFDAIRRRAENYVNCIKEC